MMPFMHQPCPFALSLACPELDEGSKGMRGFDRLSPNGTLHGRD